MSQPDTSVTYRRLRQYARPYWGLIAIGILAMALEATASGATLWLLVAIGDVHYLRGAYRDGRDALAQAVGAFAEAAENPVLCLRLGQCHLELGDEAAARRWLSAAVTAAGDEADDLFEEEDPKYQRFLDNSADPAE